MISREDRLKKMKEVLNFNFIDDVDELHDVKNAYIYDNSELSNSQIIEEIKEISANNIPTNLIYFNDNASKNYIFVVLLDMLKAARIANRSNLKMNYINVFNNYILMVFEKNTSNISDINSMEIVTTIPAPVFEPISQH